MAYRIRTPFKTLSILLLLFLILYYDRLERVQRHPLFPFTDLGHVDLR